jgi:SAM-dependent methyltransferase
MTGFSDAWLALREPADLRARNPELMGALAEAVTGREELVIVDLGCGTGSTLRALAPLFDPAIRQRWMLIDHDDRLLSAARKRLAGWADHTSEEGGDLHLKFSGRSIRVTFNRSDLAEGVEQLLQPDALVTASAFFDLVSEEWIEQFSQAAASRRCVVYAALTYDGREYWLPPILSDGAMLAAFRQHQRRNKGIGKAAGPFAAERLCSALMARGYDVMTAPSDWLLDRKKEAELIRELARGSAHAITELGLFDQTVIDNWRERRERAETVCIGHTDILGLPR